jgi:hypothetical protein
MARDNIIALVLYGAIVVLTALGGILGPPIVLLVAAGLAVLWIVMFVSGRRDEGSSGR